MYILWKLIFQVRMNSPTALTMIQIFCECTYDSRNLWSLLGLDQKMMHF